MQVFRGRRSLTAVSNWQHCLSVIRGASEQRHTAVGSWLQFGNGWAEHERDYCQPSLSSIPAQLQNPPASEAQLNEAHPVKARYLNLVSRGALKYDPKQWHVVESLGGIYDNLAVYCSSMSDYHVKLLEYQEKKQKRTQELEAQDAAAQHSQEASSQDAPGQETRSHWSFALAWRGKDEPSSNPRQKQLTPEQLAKLAAARRESQAVKELGPPPTHPTPPKGLYLWGSVGSGKSLLMDLFYDAVASSLPKLQHHQRMHFNAAMLEVHSRIHKLDQAEQQRQRRLADEAAAQSLGSQATEYRQQDEEEEEEEQGEEDWSGQPAHSRRGIFRFWDPEVQRQREAKAAFLAIRRHMRLARTGRFRPEAIARANSAQLRHIAAGFLRPDPGPAANAADSGLVTKPQHMAAVLCFDEMQVSDVFSAVALKGLLEGLTAAGCVVVTTSNRAPRELPRHGLHEDMFNHLVQTLEDTCDVMELSSQADYRRMLLEDKQLATTTAANMAAAAKASTSLHVAAATPPAGRSEEATDGAAASSSFLQLPSTFLHPLGPSAEAEMERSWQLLVAAARSRGAGGPAATTVPVMFGRQLEVPLASGGVARFAFEELCARPLGPADYVALASAFHTVFITGVPVMSMQVRDQARRFITLIDELYNARVRLVCTAAAPPDMLFSGDMGGEEPILDLEQLQFETSVEGSRLRRDLTVAGGVAPVAASSREAKEAAARLGGAEEQFAFARAVSRLHEMQSPVYLAVSAVARRWA